MIGCSASDSVAWSSVSTDVSETEMRDVMRAVAVSFWAVLFFRRIATRSAARMIARKLRGRNPGVSRMADGMAWDARWWGDYFKAESLSLLDFRLSGGFSGAVRRRSWACRGGGV